MFGGYPPTAIGYPPTAIGYPPTAISYPPAAIIGRIGHSEFFFLFYIMATPVRAMRWLSGRRMMFHCVPWQGTGSQLRAFHPRPLPTDLFVGLQVVARDRLMAHRGHRGRASQRLGVVHLCHGKCTWCARSKIPCDWGHTPAQMRAHHTCIGRRCKAAKPGCYQACAGCYWRLAVVGGCRGLDRSPGRTTVVEGR